MSKIIFEFAAKQNHAILSFNQHRGSYEPIIGYLSFGGSDDPNEWDFVSEEERLKSIQTDTLVEFQWYPKHPGTFYIIRASSIDAIEKEIEKLVKQ